MQMRNLVIVCVALFAAGLVFWPILYRYDHLGSGSGTVPLRINRLTGHTQLFVGRRWVGESDSPKTKTIPASELSKVTGNAGLGGNGYFSGRIYNGSNYVLRELDISVTAKEKGGSVRWTRTFRATLYIEPFSTGSIGFEVAGDNDIGGTEWSIVSAKGTLQRSD